MQNGDHRVAGGMAVDVEWIEVYKAPDHIEAELVRGLLEASGIPVLTEARGAQALPLILGPARVGGYISILVPPDWEEAARELLNARGEPPEPVTPSDAERGDGEGDR